MSTLGRWFLRVPIGKGDDRACPSEIGARTRTLNGGHPERTHGVRGVVAIAVIVAGIPWVGVPTLVFRDASVSNWARFMLFVVCFLGIIAFFSFKRPGPGSFVLALVAVYAPVAVYFWYGDVLLGLLFAPLPVLVFASLYWIRHPKRKGAADDIVGRRSAALGLILTYPGWFLASDFFIGGASRSMGVAFYEIELLVIAISAVVTAGWAIALFLRPTGGMFAASFLIGIVLLLFVVSVSFWIIGRDDYEVALVFGLVTAIPVMVLGWRLRIGRR